MSQRTKPTVSLLDAIAPRSWAQPAQPSDTIRDAPDPTLALAASLHKDIVRELLRLRFDVESSSLIGNGVVNALRPVFDSDASLEDKTAAALVAERVTVGMAVALAQACDADAGDDLLARYDVKDD